MTHDWIPFFTELSGKLLEYRNNREPLIQLVVDIYEKAGIDMPVLDSEKLPSDFDPFSFYALFCKNIKQNNQLKILTAISELMFIQAPLPEDLVLPVVNPLNATFYHFRNDQLYDPTEVERLWTLFDCALHYADNGAADESAFISAFDEARKIKGNRWKLTMGLFWIRPYSFADLDSRSRWYMNQHPDFPLNLKEQLKSFGNNLPSGIEYVDFCRELVQFVQNHPEEGTMPNFSRNAYLASDFDNLIDEFSGKPDEYNPSLLEYDPEITKEQWKTVLDIKRKIKDTLTLKAMKALLMMNGEASIHELHSAVVPGEKTVPSFANISGCLATMGYQAWKKFGVPFWQGAKEKGNERNNVIVAQYRYSSDRKTIRWRLRSELLEALKEYDLSDIVLTIGSDLAEYWPSQEQYPLHLTKEDWKKYIEEVEHPYHKGCMAMLKGIMELGGEATCKKLSMLYGGNTTRYVGSAVNIGKRAKQYFHLPPCMDGDVERFFPIPFIGRRVKENEVLYYSYRLRRELHEALKELDLSDIVLPEAKTEMVDFDKNQILYGPPGTGKTYHTVIYAVAIIEGKSIDAVSDEPYSEALERFNEYKSRGLIQSTTFHQSYGYEEFIEGISPVMDDNGDDPALRYVIRDGIFKKFCEEASKPVISGENGQDSIITKNPRIWKVSLGGTYDNPVRRECLDNGHIRIGWDQYGADPEKISDYSDGGKTVLNAFCNQMQIGDIVLSCYSNKLIDAVGVVTGEYEWRESYGEYCRCRNVKWLVKDIRQDIVEINSGKTMTLSTVYSLNVSLTDVMEIVDRYKGDEGTVHPNTDRYVFIIDEINRGNISKIFGELITLVEESKRGGASEEMCVTLPYSQKQFSIPDNVYLLGTMNTADRSIALMDTALRRRFSFTEMMPDSEVLRKNGADRAGEIDVAEILDVMNERITYLYDREHTIGHAFFMPLKNNPSIETLAAIFRKSVIPLLQEYFYEDYRKIQMVLGDTGKTDELKFIRDIDLDAGKLFKGDPYELNDLPERKYEINELAFLNAESYKQIL